MSSSSGRPQAPPAKRPLRSATWDAALKPAQHQAARNREQLRERALADARRRRLITAWLRELADR